jgi:hypothetical protein
MKTKMNSAKSEPSCFEPLSLRTIDPCLKNVRTVNFLDNRLALLAGEVDHTRTNPKLYVLDVKLSQIKSKEHYKFFDIFIEGLISKRKLKFRLSLLSLPLRLTNMKTKN